MTGTWDAVAASNVVTGLLGDISTNLETITRKPSYVALIPGAQAADDASDCGQLTGWILNRYRTRNFPQAANDQYDKMIDYQIVFDCRIRLVWCVAGTNPQTGAAPAASALQGDGVLLEQDAWVVWNTLECALSDLERANLVTSYLVNEQTSVGPLGQSAGTEVAFKFGLWLPCCPVTKDQSGLV